MRKKFRKPNVEYMLAVLLSFAIIIFVLFISGCGNDEKIHSKQWLYFDTIIELNIYGNPSDASLDSIWQIAKERLALWDSLTDPYDSTSALYKLNNEPIGTVKVDKNLGELINAALDWRNRTDAALEPKIGHIVTLWNIGSRAEKIPSQTEIDSALFLIKSSDIVPISDSICIISGDIKLDLGAFAKGFVVDKLYDSLIKFCIGNSAISGFLVDCGRNIRGWRRNGKSFTIGIANPRGDNIIAAFELPSGWGCASAGDYERFFIKNGIRYHHIFDPRTGKPARKAIAATAITRSAFDADAMSTAAIVMGKNIEKILDDSETTIILFYETNGNVVWESIGKKRNIFQ